MDYDCQAALRTHWVSARTYPLCAFLLPPSQQEYSYRVERTMIIPKEYSKTMGLWVNAMEWLNRLPWNLYSVKRGERTLKD